MNENTEPDDEPNVNELPGADVDSPNENPVDGDAIDPKMVPQTDDVDGRELKLNKLVVAAEELVPGLDKLAPAETDNPEHEIKDLAPVGAFPNSELPKPDVVVPSPNVGADGEEPNGLAEL